MFHSLSEADIARLDVVEKGYERRFVRIWTHNNRWQWAITYIYLDVLLQISPSEEYMHFLIAGSRGMVVSVEFCK